MTEAEFRVEVTAESARAFAELSGDWNPLHTDPSHAAATAFKTPVLHGAFSAGLLSRMAGMYLPGTDCLLHSLNLRFVAPIVPPATLLVRGVVDSDRGDVGRVTVTVSDAQTGARYVEGAYGFGRHAHGLDTKEAPTTSPADASTETDLVLVTGSNGALGGAVIRTLGARAIALPRPNRDATPATYLEQIEAMLGPRRVQGIVHCGWPAPDNTGLLSLADIETSVEHHVAAPLRQIVLLSHLLERVGREGAMLLLVGSTAAEPGRHNFRMPLYSTAKSMIPTLTRALAIELGARQKRVAAVVLDVVDGGMNERMSRSARVAHAARSPFGTIPTADHVAEQLRWLVDNGSILTSGAIISLSGGALP